jgi:uncharacterized protein YdiU (UPF0061 family)
LAEALLPLIEGDREKAIAAAMEKLEKFPDLFHSYYSAGLRAKLGLITEEDGDSELADEFLGWIKTAGADFTSSFFALTKTAETGRLDGPLSMGSAPLHAWHARWSARLELQHSHMQEALSVMHRANPVIIPRNHRVEEALSAAVAGDLSVMHRLLDLLSKPFDESGVNEPYRSGPKPSEVPYRTFCGT